MNRAIALVSAMFIGWLSVQAQFVTYHFTDGSVVTHAVTEVRSTDYTATDMRVFLWDGTTYTWSLSSLANYRFTDLSTSVPADPIRLAPLLAYPNPTSGDLCIGITALGADRTSVDVLDINGGSVRTLADGTLLEGEHRLQWDGRDHRGQKVADGAYLIRVVQGPRVATRLVMVQQ